MQRTLAGRSVSGGSFADLNEDLLGDKTLVAYAAAAGTTAADGRGRNSPYTAALLAHLEAEAALPGLPGGRGLVPPGGGPGRHSRAGQPRRDVRQRNGCSRGQRRGPEAAVRRAAEQGGAPREERPRHDVPRRSRPGGERRGRLSGGFAAPFEYMWPRLT